VLEIGRTERGVRVGGVAEQGAQITLGTGPLIEAPGDRHRDAHLLAERILGEVERVDGGVDKIAKQIPHGGGSDQRQEEIGTRLHAIATQGVAE
jgi:hypothetical protein